MLTLLLILVCTCALNVIGQPHVEYLKGVKRFNRSDYTDYYFCCNLIGDFIQWEYSNEPLKGFHTQDAGHVEVITRSTYEFTATLLSSQLDPVTNQRRLDSVLVLSFAGDHPSSFEVTCSNNSDFDTIRVDGLRGKATSSNGSNDKIALDHIVSADIVQNKSKTHIFIVGAQNDWQSCDIHDSFKTFHVSFTEHDEVGQDRTDLSQDGNFVDIQGVFIAQLPYNKTSLLLITKNSDVTVTCYFETNEAVLNSGDITVESTDPPQMSLHSPPAYNMTTGSLVFRATSILPSTAYETYDIGFIEGNKVAIAVGIGISVVIVGIMAVIIVTVVCKWIRRKKRVIKCNVCVPFERPSEKDASGPTVSLQDIGLENADTELTKSIGSLQNPSFIGLNQDYFNKSVSEKVNPVYLPPNISDSSLKKAFSYQDVSLCEKSCDTVAAGNTYIPIRVHSKDDNMNVIVAQSDKRVSSDSVLSQSETPRMPLGGPTLKIPLDEDGAGSARSTEY